MDLFALYEGEYGWSWNTKKTNMPVHSCINANESNGLREYSMVLGEQIITISKNEVISKRGTVINENDRRLIDKACFNGLFFGTDYRLEEVAEKCM